MVCKSCCCDKCNDWRLGCDCCRCIPKRMCATLRTEDEYDDDPADLAVAPRMEVEPFEGIPIYEFAIPVPDEYGPIDILLSLVTLEEYCDPDDPEEEENRCCRWRVESDYLGIDEYYEVRGYDGIGCSSKTFSLDLGSEDGTIEIRPHLHGEVKVAQEDYGRCKEPFCGDCRCVCGTLCVTEYIEGFPEEPVLYEWDKEARSWGGGEDGFPLLRDEDTGGCLIGVPGFDPVEITCPEIADSVFDDYGNGFAFECWDCKCNQTTRCFEDSLPKSLQFTTGIISFGLPFAGFLDSPVNEQSFWEGSGSVVRTVADEGSGSSCDADQIVTHEVRAKFECSSGGLVLTVRSIGTRISDGAVLWDDNHMVGDPATTENIDATYFHWDNDPPNSNRRIRYTGVQPCPLPGYFVDPDYYITV